jgi:hypothetical protein
MRKSCYTTVILTILFSAGCAHYGALEDDFGKSYRMARDGQILNPEASKNLTPVTGLNSKAADAAVNKYIDSFSKGGTEQAAKQESTGKTGCATGTDTYGK